MNGSRNFRAKSSGQKKYSNGRSKNGRLSELDTFLANREERMMEIYGRDWTPTEVEELRKKIERANAEANEVKKEWGLI